MARKNNNEVAEWDAFLAEKAKAEAEHENVGEFIPSISIKNGILKLDNTPFPENKIAVIVAANVFENTYYDVPYDPDNPTTPACYAFGKTNDNMIPNEGARDIQCERCAECQKNMFGSADTGKGKACANRRTLLCLPAGEYNKKTSEWILDIDADTLSEVTPAILKIPPTSLIEFAKHVKSVFAELKRPVDSIVTEIKVIPDDKKQFIVKFNVLDTLSMDAYKAISDKQEDFYAAITKPYANIVEDDGPAKNKKINNKISRRK